MPRNKISDNIEGIVKYLLTKKYSYYVIQQELARMNFNVSKSTISRIANKVGKQRQLCLLNSEKAKFHRRRHIATPSIVRRITSYINKENPPTISLTSWGPRILAFCATTVKYKKTHSLLRSVTLNQLCARSVFCHLYSKDLCCRLDIDSLYCMKKNALHKNRFQDIGRTLACSERLEFKMDKENFFDDEATVKMRKTR